jgi:hypothetical protein
MPTLSTARLDRLFKSAAWARGQALYWQMEFEHNAKTADERHNALARQTAAERRAYLAVSPVPIVAVPLTVDEVRAVQAAIVRPGVVVPIGRYKPAEEA